MLFAWGVLCLVSVKRAVKRVVKLSRGASRETTNWVRETPGRVSSGWVGCVYIYLPRVRKGGMVGVQLKGGR